MKMEYQGVSTEQQVYFIEGLKVNLLSQPALREMDIVRRLDALDTTAAVKSRFPSVFRGLGTLGKI